MPPSVDLKSPLPGPPLSRPHVWISICHMPAKSTRGFDGFIAMSEQPVFSSTKSVRCHVLPPSAVRKTPRSSCGPYAWPTAHAITTSGLVGSISMRAMRPVFSSPISVHVRPASVDLNMPAPTEMWLRMNGSPVPAHTMFGSDGATAIDPTDETDCESKIGNQWTPPSVVFHTPPDAAPT